MKGLFLIVEAILCQKVLCLDKKGHFQKNTGSQITIAPQKSSQRAIPIYYSLLFHFQSLLLCNSGDRTKQNENSKERGEIFSLWTLVRDWGALKGSEREEEKEEKKEEEEERSLYLG